MSDKKTIRELYNSIQEDFDKELVDNPKYQEIFERFDKKENLLQNTISPDEFKIFEEFLDVYSELILFEAEESFVKGFSMANKLLIDSLER